MSRPVLKALREVAEAVLLALLIFFGTRTVLQAREVIGPSMQPIFHTGERLFVNRAIYRFHAPEHGDVIIFKPPIPSHDEFIKRVIGVPGDHVVISGGRVSVNGQVLSEPYIHGAVTDCAGQWCDLVLGPNQYYVLGDNRPSSSDSRVWGPVQADSVVGEAWLIYFPFKDVSLLP